MFEKPLERESKKVLWCLTFVSEMESGEVARKPALEHHRFGPGSLNAPKPAVAFSPVLTLCPPPRPPHLETSSSRSHAVWGRSGAWALRWSEAGRSRLAPDPFILALTASSSQHGLSSTPAGASRPPEPDREQASQPPCPWHARHVWEEAQRPAPSGMP